MPEDEPGMIPAGTGNPGDTTAATTTTSSTSSTTHNNKILSGSAHPDMLNVLLR